MSRIAAPAEIAKLAYALEVQPDSLGYLDGIPAAQIRAMREAVYERMFVHDQRVYLRLAAVVRWLPVWLTVWLAPRFGPRMVARVAGEMPSRRAAQIAERLPGDFLADVTGFLDPRRVRDLIQRLSIDKIVAVAQELFTRNEYIILGRFVNYLPDAAVQAVLAKTGDDVQLVRVAFYVESRNRLTHIVRLLPEQRLRRIILLCVEPDCPVMIELIALVVNVSYALQRQLGDLAAAQDEAVLEHIIETTQTQGLWADLLPVIGVLSPASQRKVVNLPALRRDRAVFRSILQVAHEHDLWTAVLPLAQMMDDAMRDALSEHINNMPAAAIRQTLTAALLGEHWQLLLDLAQRLPESKQREVAELVVPLGSVDPALLERIVTAVSDLGYRHVFDGLLPADFEFADASV